MLRSVLPAEIAGRGHERGPAEKKGEGSLVGMAVAAGAVPLAQAREHISSAASSSTMIFFTSYSLLVSCYLVKGPNQTSSNSSMIGISSAKSSRNSSASMARKLLTTWDR